MSRASGDVPEKQRHCWHPVAYAHEVTDRPFGATLLGEAVVVWRTSDGRAHAMRDLCIHRGTALSLGWVADDCLVCPYHAWRYDASGACVRIPQSATAIIPAKARTPVYRCQERYGLVWVCLADEGEPAYALPEVPELESGAWKVVNTGPFAWHSDASRQVENFTDFGHFPWVHPGLLGDPGTSGGARAQRGDARARAALHHRPARGAQQRRLPGVRQPRHGEAGAAQPLRAAALPYTIVLRLGWGGDKGMVYFFASQPETPERCRGYCIIGRNYDFDDPDSTLQEFERVIFGQDQRIVESQRPEQVPFDLADELHLKFDAVAVAYRRAMRAEGLVNAVTR